MVTEQVRDEPTQTLTENDKFYGDKLGFLSILILFTIGLAVLFLFLTIALRPLKNPFPLFFKAGENGELIQEVALNQPNITTNILLNWVTESMIMSNTFNFVNYATRIESAREHFTPEGFESFTKALQDTQLLQTVINNKFVVRAMPTAAPQIVKEGELANRYLWKIKLPMVFQYRSVGSSLFDFADLSILVVRVPTTVSANGLKILRYEIIIRSAGL
jgi:hypothetical protein